MGSLSIDRLELILSSAFIQLLDLSISTIRHEPDYPTGGPSYNVILTLEHLHLVPRKHETYTLRETGEKISINSMGFAGMLLVRNVAELEAVKREGVASILRGVGLQSVHDLQVEGTAREM
jgi:ATP adenylyltransferase